MPSTAASGKAEAAAALGAALGTTAELSDRALAVAKAELREDRSTREQALQQFRDWIAKNQDLQNCRTDASFLLRFLRVKKFSLPMAQQTLLKYLNMRQTFEHLIFDLDPSIPSVDALITSGYLFASPIRDAKGRRVIIALGGKMDPSRFTNVDMAKVHCITYETLMDDEENQVMGFTHFADLEGLSPSCVTMWSPTEFAHCLRWGEQSLPMRHKEVHFLNLPTPLKYVYDFARNRFSQKIRSRFLIHSTRDALHKHLDKKCLPREYGGDMPMAQMIDLWKEEIASKQKRIMSLDDMKLLSDQGIVTRKTTNPAGSTCTGVSTITGSFRRLEVD
ncbi:clavesin-1 isoform X2 [Thrips palmi]|uniref:Clavesin-1 isoform X2 n=1 Tax=Thrips palmi TaxID=161013 RepID=A0A6P8YEX4_THRPL|nr:clavesin-1 isoform X2 [Thrips palmi]